MGLLERTTGSSSSLELSSSSSLSMSGFGQTPSAFGETPPGHEAVSAVANRVADGMVLDRVSRPAVAAIRREVASANLMVRCVRGVGCARSASEK